MPAPRSHRRARLATLVSIALAITGFQFLVATAADANPGGTGLVISEVYGGGGNSGATYTNDFVELYNPTSSAIPLSGMSLQYRSAASTAASSNVASLNTAGSVPAHDWFVVTLAGGANGVPVPNVDFAGNAINMSGTSGQIYLANSLVGIDADGAGNTAVTDPAVIDFVGFGSPAIKEGATPAPAPSNTTSVARDATGTDTDVNGSDFTVQTAMNPGAGVAPVSVTAPGSKTGVVGTQIAPFQLAATGGVPPYTWSATGMPPGVTVASDGTVSGTPTTADVYTPTVTVSDSTNPTPATDSKQFTFTITAAPPPVTAISAIQGTGAASPLVGQSVNTQGVVTAAYPAGGLKGFYIQTPGPDTADASDAIFVFANNAAPAGYPAVGDSLDVTGTVAENFEQTELTGASWTPHGSSLGTVTPKTVIPGTDCALPGDTCLSGAALDAAREVSEGEAFQPAASNDWTLTDVYDGAPFYGTGLTNGSSNFGEMGVAAESDQALIAPTELFDVQNEATQVANRTKWNDAHRIILDDGSSTNYTTTNGSPFPWMTPSYVPRVGAPVTFPAPVILYKDFGVWRVEPSTQVVGAPSATQPQLAQTRAAIAGGPENIGGDLKLATFNVLNFFPTDGNEYETLDPNNHCTYFTDRTGLNQITTNACGNPSTSAGNGPRGAANQANVARQRDKIVSAINTANADIVSLEELENSVKFGKDRDYAITQLVNALNAGNPGKWAFVPSPSADKLPAVADQDVIRTGFIYQPATVALVGASRVLANQSSGSQTFANAREPLAQAFKAVGTPDGSAFAVVVNHFKSKGSGVDDGTGQGNANPDRVAQAQSLLTFANQFKLDRGITRVFLVGDFNAYSSEDPAQVITGGGYTEEHSTTDPDEETYNFDGQIGSLDHVFANSAAAADVTGADVWTINGYESVYYEYSRFNYNATNLYDSGPFRSSDHSPEIVGIHADSTEPATRDIQILGTNDFHGRIANDPTAASAGAAVMAGAVKQLRQQNPDTVFAAAGDLIGASTFESFIDKDKPTIDAPNSAGLEVSSVGNHEFDQGFDDLVNRVMNPAAPKGGAQWQYLAANIRNKSDNQRPLAPSWTKTFGSVKVGFIGAVTEHLPELVSPAGISQINVTNIVTEVNSEADALRAGGADVIVLLVHEGAASTSCSGDMVDPTSDFGKIVNGVDTNVDAIVSGHTHLEYNCSIPVPAWAADVNHPVKERPVVSAGQYGFALNKLDFTGDTATGKILDKAQTVLKLKNGTSGSNFNYPVDQPTQAIVDAAVANAAVLGAQPVGKISAPLYRGKLADGTTENRGQESTLGNLVAEVQQTSTEDPALGGAQIAFMNPGGLRQDLLGNGGGSPRDVSYRQAADVQPFGNTLVNMKLTGAQIKTVLEQQWQPAGAARPFLKLGISKGFLYTYDPTAATGSHIKHMWLNGTSIDPAASYSVTVNSFLASGGDNFLELNNGTQKHDAGQVDLQAFVNYMQQFSATALQVDFSQRAVGVTFPAAAPGSYTPGDHVKFDVSSWAMTGPADVKDTNLQVKLGSTVLDSFPLDNAAVATTDEAGKASVDVVVPNAQAPGPMTLTLVGAQTGTESQVTVQVGKADTQSAAADASVVYGQAAPIQVTVSGGATSPTGTVHLKDGATEITSGTLDATGKVTLTVPAKAYSVGQVTLTAVYDGDAAHNGSQSTLSLTTTKASSTTVAPDASVTYGQATSVTVTVTAPNLAPTGAVTVKNGGAVLGTAALASGSAKVTIPAGALAVGAHSLTAEYSGDANVQPSTDGLTFTVTKAGSTTTAKVKPGHPKAHHKVKLKLTVEGANGVVATGQVTIKVDGKTLTGTLKNGELTEKLGSFAKGDYHAKVVYLGDGNVAGSKTKVKFTVS